MNLHGTGTPSDWVVRWTPLAAPQGTVLDVACGAGRHMAWFAQQGFQVTGIDRNPEAAAAASAFGQVAVADIENGAWPLLYKDMPLQFDVLVVTNYLWRALFPTLLASVKPGACCCTKPLRSAMKRWANHRVWIFYCVPVNCCSCARASGWSPLRTALSMHRRVLCSALRPSPQARSSAKTRHRSAIRSR